jgi:4-amino-4-deoxy-L-arabinose transferase-like glycosyltransferase
VVKWKKEWESSEDREEEEEQEEQRVHAQTIYYQENLAFCFSHAQSRTTLVFCRSLGFLGFLGFLVPWFSCSLVFLFLGFLPLQMNQIWRILSVIQGEEGERTLFVCLQNYISMICLNVIFANYNFDKNEIKSNISI